MISYNSYSVGVSADDDIIVLVVHHAPFLYPVLFHDLDLFPDPMALQRVDKIASIVIVLQGTTICNIFVNNS